MDIRRWIVLAIMPYLLATAGCMVSPKVLTEEEIRSRIAQDLNGLAQDVEPLAGPIDLYEAMARTLKHNLDVKVEVMHQMLAHQQLDLSHYSLLPRLVANAGYDGRNNFTGGVSRSLITGQQTLEPSTSADRDIFGSDLTLSWNVLDFGLSYVRAQQAADDVLIAEEEKRRVAIRVMQEVRAAYWRAVSADRLLTRLAFLDKWFTKAVENAKIIQDERLENPLAPLQYQRELINNRREVQKLFRDLSTAKMELASLMGLPPGARFRLASPTAQQVIPVVALPLEDLEQRALLNRPELRTIDYRKRINAKETRVAILEMLPNLNLQVGPNWNSNTFLFNQHWLAYGARVSWNLLSLFRQPARFKTIEAQKDLLNAQSLALTMAIMTQVHVSLAKFAYAQKELATAREYHDAQAQIVQHTSRSFVTNRVSEQTLLHEKVTQVVAEVRHHAAQAELEAAYANLLSAIGEDLLPPAADEKSIAQVAETLRSHWTALSTGI